jgi:CheY-like chemotaxis protein
MIRELVDLHLANAGFDVLLAEDAVDAGRLVVEASPALILIDVNMPYMDGYEFTAALKADPATRDIPVVFITSDEDVAQSFAFSPPALRRSSGFRAFVRKYFTFGGYSSDADEELLPCEICKKKFVAIGRRDQ